MPNMAAAGYAALVAFLAGSSYGQEMKTFEQVGIEMRGLYGADTIDSLAAQYAKQGADTRKIEVEAYQFCAAAGEDKILTRDEFKAYIKKGSEDYKMYINPDATVSMPDIAQMDHFFGKGVNEIDFESSLRFSAASMGDHAFGSHLYSPEFLAQLGVLPPVCQGDISTWNAKGTCATYAQDLPNHEWCDYAHADDFIANQVCPQCGKCSLQACTSTFQSRRGTKIKRVQVSGNTDADLDQACCAVCTAQAACEFWIRDGGSSGPKTCTLYKGAVPNSESEDGRRGGWRQASAPVFSLVDDNPEGSCVISGRCVRSRNFPNGNYQNRDKCTIETQVKTDISVLEFDTEESYDQMTIHEKSYSGKLDYDFGTELQPNVWIKWEADGDQPHHGWQFCGSGCEDADGTVFRKQLELITGIPPRMAMSCRGIEGMNDGCDNPTGSISIKHGPAVLDLMNVYCQKTCGCRGNAARTTMTTTAPSFGHSWWSITENNDGSCQISQNCIQSRNYPSAYNDGDSCRAMLTRPATLEFEQFGTESGYDKLAVRTSDGVTTAWCSGSDTDCIILSHLQAVGEIQWEADGSQATAPGWKLCAKPQAATQPVQFLSFPVTMARSAEHNTSHAVKTQASFVTV